MRIQIVIQQTRGRGLPGAFTMIELILVMTVLTIAISLTAPALANFFRGRSLDSEARRLLALTRLGQSRAVSEGFPVELWLDANQGKFGLEAEASFEETDSKAVEFALDSDMQLEAGTVNMSLLGNDFGTSEFSANPALSQSRHPNVPKIRFLPDGSLSESSPASIRLTGRDGGSLYLVQSRNRLSYEIRNRNN